MYNQDKSMHSELLETHIKSQPFVVNTPATLTIKGKNGVMEGHKCRTVRDGDTGCAHGAHFVAETLLHVGGDSTGAFIQDCKSWTVIEETSHAEALLLSK